MAGKPNKRPTSTPQRPRQNDPPGLPLYAYIETDEQRAKRKAGVESRVRDVFRDAMYHLGEADAKRLFKEVISKQGKHGKRKSLLPQRDELLLQKYDALARKAPKRKHLVTILSELLHKNYPGQFGASQSAIAKQIRRLLAARDKDAEAEERRFQEYRERYRKRWGKYPTFHSFFDF